MSTKAIRAALEAVRWDGLNGKEHPSYVAALAELEAIEKAARDISAYLSHGQPERYCLALALFDRIAKDAKS